MEKRGVIDDRTPDIEGKVKPDASKEAKLAQLDDDIRKRLATTAKRQNKK